MHKFNHVMHIYIYLYTHVHTIQSSMPLAGSSQRPRFLVKLICFGHIEPSSRIEDISRKLLHCMILLASVIIHSSSSKESEVEVGTSAPFGLIRMNR